MRLQQWRTIFDKYLFPYNKVGYGQTVAMIYLVICIVISTFVTNRLRRREIDL